MILFLDPVYTLSSERDHARSTFRGSTNASQIVSYLVFLKSVLVVENYLMLVVLLMRRVNEKIV